MVNKVTTFKYKEKTIVLEDYSDNSIEEMLNALDTAHEIIISLPKGSVLSLIDVTNTHFNPSIIEKMSTNAKLQDEYLKKSAVVGVKGLKKFLFKTISKMACQSVSETFDSIDEAKEWLVSDEE